MNDFQKQFKRQRSLFSYFFAFACFLIVCYFVVMGVFAYKALTLVGDADWTGGVKPVIERIWCGSVGCMDSPSR